MKVEQKVIVNKLASKPNFLKVKVQTKPAVNVDYNFSSIDNKQNE